MTPQMELIASPSTNCRPTYACASVQTELTFEPDCFVTFDSHPVEVVEDESEEEEPVSSTDPLWIPVEEEQPEEEMPETVSEENPATELKVIVFWKQLLLLLQCCQICKAPAHVYERVTTVIRTASLIFEISKLVTRKISLLAAGWYKKLQQQTATGTTETSIYFSNHSFEITVNFFERSDVLSLCNEFNVYMFI